MNIYTPLTEGLIAIEKLILELATRNCLVTAIFPSLIAKSW
jgi:hypothetical protein